MHRVAPLLLFLVCWLHPPAARALPPDTWVVSIGNNHGKADEVSLQYAQRDAGNFAEVLRAMGGVPSSRIVQLRDETASGVRTALLELNARIRDTAAGRPSALVVFYSGHASAGALHLGDTSLPFDELRAILRASPAKARVLFVDACRSGGVSRVKGVKAAKSFDIKVVEAPIEGVAIITSSSADENSQESDRLRGSFFSHHLLTGLRGAADKNGDGKVTLEEAYAYSYAETVRSSGQTMELQHPTYNWEMKGRGGLVMTQLDSKRLGRVKLPRPGVYLFGDASAGGQIISEAHPDRPNVELALAARRYTVQERQARAYLTYEFDLAAGRTVDLSKVPARAVRYDRLVRKGGGSRSAVHGVMGLYGVRGELVPGEGPALQAVLGYNVDLEHFSLSFRPRFRISDPDAELPRSHREFGMGFVMQRFVDFNALTVGAGLLFDATHHVQAFKTTDRIARAADSWSGGFGLLFSVERNIWEGVGFRLEGGPLATLIRLGLMDELTPTGSETEAIVTWWAGGGPTWRF